MEASERARLDAYFGQIATRFAPAADPPAALLITHLLPERPAFVRGVAAVTDLRAVLPKPKSVHAEALREIEGGGYVCDTDPVRRTQALSQVSWWRVHSWRALRARDSSCAPRVRSRCAVRTSDGYATADEPKAPCTPAYTWPPL